MSYAEIHCQSAFSFHEGASLPEELVAQASKLGIRALGICDRNGVYGLVRAWKAGEQHNVHVLSGAIVSIQGAADLVLYAACETGWSNLCEVLTRANENPSKRSLNPEDLLTYQDGLVVLMGPEWAEVPKTAATIADILGDRLYIEAHRQRLSTDVLHNAKSKHLSRHLGRHIVATSRALHHCPERQPLQDVLRCIQHKVSLDAAGRLLEPNAERHLRPIPDMMALFADQPDWLNRTLEVAERCEFDLGQLSYRYPREVVPDGHTPMSWLRVLTEKGCTSRWPQGPPPQVLEQLEHELQLIDELGFATYFLTVQDIVAIAQDKQILCQGRGSAANSAVCYVLGITAVDPSRSRMLFERFISKERAEPPDIDVDFEHERREEIIQAIYEKYGRHRAAMVNEVISYRPRSAIRDVGKALGLSLEQVDKMAKCVDRWSDALSPARAKEAGVDPEDPRVAATLERARDILGFPRHVSIHVGGFVIAAENLRARCPVEPASMKDRTVIQWDKDDVDAVGFVKVDVLALGMLTAIRKCFSLLKEHEGVELDLASVPAEDPDVYEMLCKADSIGIFQVESRAQMSMLPRLKPRCFYDLVIEISIVRPGPIQGGMVHPYLDRRKGKEPITYAHPDLVPILERTLGVPIFQEQVMEMAMAVGGFSPGQADALRRAMGAWRKRGGLHPLIQRLVANMKAKGIEDAYADQVAQQIMGFGEYGFPESHAASFALLVYVSAYLKCHHPAAFTTALLNSQPMGFYPPSLLVADVRRHGVEVRKVCVLHSNWDCTLEKSALRLGLRQVKGLGEPAAQRLVQARSEQEFCGLTDVAHRARLDRGALRRLAEANAFEGLGLPRREALWQVEGLWQGPLLEGVPAPQEDTRLPTPSELENLQEDYRATGLCLTHHPVALLRERLTHQQVLPIEQLTQQPDGARVRIAGLVTCRQRPSTASGVLFMTFEDETGLANLVVWPKTYERQRRLVRGENLLIVTGKLQRQDEAISILAQQFQPLSLEKVHTQSRDFK
ncbi:MAG: error-prone DNA polymerase [Myxococcota bacterium]|nr:error-prone DNA polymerase [Myxococcota bacterium]